MPRPFIFETVVAVSINSVEHEWTLRITGQFSPGTKATLAYPAEDPTFDLYRTEIKRRSGFWENVPEWLLTDAQWDAIEDEGVRRFLETDEAAREAEEERRAVLAATLGIGSAA